MQHTNTQACKADHILLSDFHGFFIVRAEEVIGAVLLHSLSAIFSYVEHWMRKTRTAWVT